MDDCMNLTYVCCFNNKTILEEMLMHSFANIDKAWNRNILLIDNTKGRYSSCAEAYNKELLNKSIGDILVFIHQDIAFENREFEKRIVQELTDNPNQILGFAGMTEQGVVVSNLRYLSTKKYITKRQIVEKTECIAVDECCFAMTADLYKQLKFDEQVCFHWHLYATEICYNAHKQFGTRICVIPEEIYHKKNGSDGLHTDMYYLRTLWRLADKYRADLEEIRTPCYIVSTHPIKFFLKIFRTFIRNHILK